MDEAAFTAPPFTAPALRRRRLAAAGADAATLALALLAAGALATAWLLVRTAWGRDDTTQGEAALAFALGGAAVPAWTAWVTLHLYDRGATPGQRWQRLAIEAVSPARRALRLAAHPLALPAWGWLLTVLFLLDARWLAAPAVLLTLAVMGSALASLVLLLVRPAWRGPHDRLARTRLTAGR